MARAQQNKPSPSASPNRDRPAPPFPPAAPGTIKAGPGTSGSGLASARGRSLSDLSTTLEVRSDHNRFIGIATQGIVSKIDVGASGSLTVDSLHIFMARATCGEEHD